MLETIAAICAVCNQSRLELKEGQIKAVGSPTEAALKVLTEKLGVSNGSKQQAIKAARAKGDEAEGACLEYTAR